MNLDFEYETLNPTDYGLILHNPENRVFMSPSYFFLGDIHGAMPGQISDWFAEWLAMENQPDKDFVPLFVFNPDKKYNVARNEDGKLIKRKIHAMRPAELRDAAAFRTSLTRHHGTKTFINMGGDDIFVPRKNEVSVLPHTGESVLTGRARKKGDARTDATYHKLRIIGPFRDSGEKGALFANVSCDCTWAYVIEGKNSYWPIQILDSDLAGLLQYAAGNPRKVKGKPAGRNFFVPFRTDSIDESTLQFHTVEEMPFLSETVRDLTPLKMSVFVKKYFDNATHFSIDRRLTKCPVFDPLTIQLIRERRADYRILLDAFPFTRGKRRGFEEHLQGLYWGMFRQLSREGFTLDGAVLENKDTPYESACLHFEGPDGRMARVAVNGLPPVIIRRKRLPKKIVAPVRDYTSSVKSSKEHPSINPFADLYKRPTTPRMDDMTRAGTEYMVTLPAFIPQALWQDYGRVIEGAIKEYNEKRNRDYAQAESFNGIATRARAYGFKGTAKLVERIRASLT